MKVQRFALLSLLGLGLSAGPSLVFADVPKIADAPKTEAPKTDAPKVEEDPTVGAVKGNSEKQKASFLARHEGFLKDRDTLLKNGPIQFVLIGDSITDGWRGGGKKTFEEYYAKYNAYNIGIGGDRTQHVIWRIDNGELDGIKPDPKVAMLMIGTNNLGPNKSDEAIAAGITKIVGQIHSKLPTTKVLLLAVFPRGETAADPFRARIKHINEMISKLDDGGKTVKFLDIGDKFLEADGSLPRLDKKNPTAHTGTMNDALHPNAKGYDVWAKAVQPTIDELMK